MLINTEGGDEARNWRLDNNYVKIVYELCVYVFQLGQNQPLPHQQHSPLILSLLTLHRSSAFVTRTTENGVCNAKL